MRQAQLDLVIQPLELPPFRKDTFTKCVEPGWSVLGMSKLKVLDECKNGLTAAEAARKYQIPMQNVVKWKSQVRKKKIQKLKNQIPLARTMKH